MPEKKKVGRPKKNTSKKVQVNVRLDDNDLKKLVQNIHFLSIIFYI